jgi:hypothetical protein
LAAQKYKKVGGKVGMLVRKICSAKAHPDIFETEKSKYHYTGSGGYNNAENAISE